ncbi:uncharacterized protein B0H64DRAFT_395148 [Chaetomium fimeti]|uniref:Uncharacterized protein n=1 Tax=Chaetomium fimeti TaxID=1854472 RepID=A0AAE0LRQ0_9PEZI|nr:hypothetical protein B0H64DRAFT_395148 [Chaetomium fimeti]
MACTSCHVLTGLTLVNQLFSLWMMLFVEFAWQVGGHWFCNEADVRRAESLRPAERRPMSCSWNIMCEVESLVRLSKATAR